MRRRFTENKGFTKTFDFNNYLTIEAIEDNFTVSFLNDIEYGIDGKGWIKLKAGMETPSINTGQTLSFRGELTPTVNVGIGTFVISKRCNIKGNCMSMLFGDNAVDNHSLNGKNYAFCKLFYNCKNIVSVSSNLLPATTLARECYSWMFYDCTSLTTAPELPATTLARECYSHMFQGCSSLTTAPKLPATTLAMICYEFMFYDCKKLNYIKMLATDISASYCLDFWVQNVSSTGTFVKNPTMVLLPTATSSNHYAGIPSGWTVVNDGEDSSDSGKIVNHGVITTSGNFGQFLTLTFEYPVATALEVLCGDAEFILRVGETTFNWTLGPGESLGSTVRCYPSNEDDTYIYEITIE